jgi:hypothetical protein
MSNASHTSRSTDLGDRVTGDHCERGIDLDVQVDVDLGHRPPCPDVVAAEHSGHMATLRRRFVAGSMRAVSDSVTVACLNTFHAV